MNTPTQTAFPLDGLLRCGQCGERMTLEDGPAPQYICQRGCSTPRLRAGAVDTMLLGAVLQEVLTPRNTRMLLDAANEELGGETGEQHLMTAQDIEDLKRKPDLLISAAEGTGEVRALLGRFIVEIRVHADRAMVHYSIPLPDDSNLAGMQHQEIAWPPGGQA